jgi:hypothetical protein
MTSKRIPRLSISDSRSTACFFQSGVSRTRNGNARPCRFNASSAAQHSQAVVRERLRVHLSLSQKSRRCASSDGSYSIHDPQKVNADGALEMLTCRYGLLNGTRPPYVRTLAGGMVVRRTLAQLFQKAPQSCASTDVFVGGVLSTRVALAMEINLRLAWARPVGVFIAPWRAACLSSLKSVILENEKSNTEG